MKKLYIILLIIANFASTSAFAYEAGKQQKIDVVNSYQPTQFEGQSALNKLQKKELLDLKFQTTQSRDLFIETTPLISETQKKSPLSKTDSPVYGIKEKPYFVKPLSEDLLPSENYWDTDKDLALQGGVLAEEKPRKRLFTKQNWHKTCTFIKGEPSYDAVILGMQSIHTSKERDFRNNTNNMMAFQYGGVSAGYFYNSWYRDTYFLAVARRIWKKEFNKDWSMDVQYKAGIMHGYKEEAPIQLGWIEPVIIPIVGLNYKTSGLDFIIIPSAAPVFAVSCRFGLPDPITYKTVHAKIEAKRPPKPIAPAPVDQYDRIKPAIINPNI